MWGDTVLSVLKPAWILSQIFGMCNRSIYEKIHNKKPPIFRIIFTYLYALVAIAMIIFLTYETSDFTITHNKKIVIQLADLLFNITNNISMVATISFCLWHSSKLTTVVRRLHDIDNELKKLIKWKTYKNVKIFVLCELGFTFSIWISFFVYYVIVQCPNSTLECFKGWFIIYTSTKISQVLLVVFCAFVVVLKHKINVINENIRQLFKEQNSRMKPVPDLFYEKTLNDIEKIHNEVSIACNEVQTIFSVPVLMKVANQFVSIFSGLYFCVFGYFYNGHYVKPKYFNEFMIPLVTIVIAVVELLTTVTVCEFTVSELRTTGRLIYRIPMPRNNIMLMKRINLFSLQLIHTNFEFTASGFFKINGSLLQTIAGAVTVYLVMFIQFDIATNKDPV